MKVREYGKAGPTVLVLHGGPGAAGYMAPVARGLADRFRVLEPFQRGAGDEPLSVARHVDDLQRLIRARCVDAPPALVGHSWGAMLALAHAAAHPEAVRALALIGCGTFDTAARRRLQATHEARMDAQLRRRLASLEQQFPDADQRLRATGDLLLPVYSHDLVATRQELEACDARAHHETWQDMLRQQQSGVYPAAFAAIEAPVLMLHGAADPHPGPMIRASLRTYLPQLEYREWERCGHYPWLERAVRAEFFAMLKDWLVRTLGESAAGR